MDITNNLMKGNPTQFINLDRDEFFYWDNDGVGRSRLCLRTSPTSFYDLIHHLHYKVKEDGSYCDQDKSQKLKLDFSLSDNVVPVYVRIKVTHFK